MNAEFSEPQQTRACALSAKHSLPGLPNTTQLLLQVASPADSALDSASCYYSLFAKLHNLTSTHPQIANSRLETEGLLQVFHHPK